LVIETCRRLVCRGACLTVPAPVLVLRPRILRLACFLAVVLSLVCTPSRVAAQFDDDQVKAAFLLNFLKFVTWPDDHAAPDAPIVIVVLGNESLARIVEQTAAKQAGGGRAVVVRAARTARDIPAAPHLLFISASEQDRLAVLLRQYEGRPVLTVGDGAGYGAAGVVLNSYTSDTRIRFEANTTAAAHAGLQISSHLLRLARIVG
jgi:hypothetical protein